MSTPLCDFVRRYAEAQPLRLHMPGHKGVSLLGPEPLDITEIDGADELFAPSGILADSEAQASRAFGAPTLYSAGGSTLCIQAMLYLAMLSAAAAGRRPHILAGRNAHKAFLHAAALLDIGITWLYPAGETPYYACPITPEQVSAALSADPRPTAVYLTSPDYLGGQVPLREIAEVCRRAGVLLLVDNAHGAYLRFLPESQHPLDLGADLCCDSAHKTLPVLTGGAYLHLSPRLPAALRGRAHDALSLFGSSSPSYLILQSLDAMNDRFGAFRGALSAFLPQAEELKAQLNADGWSLTGEEPLKLTLCPKSRGYTGIEVARHLESLGIFPEFYDPDLVVLMLSPYCGRPELDRLRQALTRLPPRPAVTALPPPLPHPVRVLSPREALCRPAERLPLADCEGRISAAAALSCPPAIPLAVCGERIDREVLRCLRYYGAEACTVLCEPHKESRPFSAEKA